MGMRINTANVQALHTFKAEAFNSEPQPLIKR